MSNTIVVPVASSNDKFYKISIADMLAKNIYTVTKGSVETIEADTLYAVVYQTKIKIGIWNLQTGALTSNFNTDFGIDKQQINNLFMPTINAGDCNIWYDSNQSVGNVRGIEVLISNGELSFGTYVDQPKSFICVEEAANNLHLYLSQKVYFEGDPTSWGWEEVREYLAGYDQATMGYATTIGLRLNVPKSVNVTVKE